MKILFIISAVILLLSFMGCNEREQNYVSNGSSTIETTYLEGEDSSNGEESLTDSEVPVTHPHTTTPFVTEISSETPAETSVVTETDVETTVDTTTEPEETTPIDTHKFILSGVPYISQRKQYPNGCESVSTVMALKYLGVDISVDSFIDTYLECGPAPVVNGIGCDPNDVYLGNPRRNSGWGCYAPVIARALDGVFNDTRYRYSLSYEKTLDDLCEEYIDNGVPVIVWGTLNMSGYSGTKAYAHWKTTEGKSISYHVNLHCLLLVGYDDYNFYFLDPNVKGGYVGGAIKYSREKSNKAFALLGSQSIALFEISDAESETGEDTETSFETEGIFETTDETEITSDTDNIFETESTEGTDMVSDTETIEQTETIDEKETIDETDSISEPETTTFLDTENLLDTEPII